MRLWLPLLAGLAACSSQTPFYGPLPTRNQHPAQLTVLQMDPRTGKVLPSGSPDLRVDAAYTSLFQGGIEGGDLYNMDGEILRTRFKARVGLGGGVEAFTELPFAYTTGGFLDSFLIDWHDFWGLPDQDRPQNPRNQWEVRAERQGVTVYEMQEGGLELLDIPIGLAWNPWSDAGGPFDVLFRGAVEFPTGDQDAGFGNGEVDVSLGIVGEYRFDGWALTAYAQHTFAGTPDRAVAGGIGFSDITAVGLGTEVALGDTTTLLFQSQFETSTLRELDVDEAQDPQWLWTLGLRQLLGDGFYLELAIIEDLSPNVAPDFSAWLGVGWMPSLAKSP